MIDVLATLCVTVGILCFIDFFTNIIMAKAYKPLLFIRASLIIMIALALTSDAFAGGELLLAIPTISFSAISVAGHVLCLNDRKEKFDSFFENLVIESIFIASSFGCLK